MQQVREGYVNRTSPLVEKSLGINNTVRIISIRKNAFTLIQCTHILYQPMVQNVTSYM